MTRSILAAAAASFVFAAAGFAQEETPAPTTYVLAEDGSATHNATGAVCPATIGELLLAQVMTFDREETHLGIGCQYISPSGFTAAISILKADEPELVGQGDSAARWNASLYQILGSYPAALPANAAGLGGDDGAGMRGALFTANANGVPVRIGVWQIETPDWQYRAQATFVPTGENGWSVAEQTRTALMATKSSAN